MSSDFIKGFLSCLGAAIGFAVLVFCAHRYGREPVLDDLDYDDGTPDGFVDHFKGDKQ